jgi:GNAT superfamily N-acetyltransferase
MTTPDPISLRRATVSDAPAIARHRRQMFRDMGYRDEAHLDSMMAKFLPWVEAKIATGDYLAWFAVDDKEEKVVDREEKIVAGAGLWLMDWPPHMVGSSPLRGNILNVYTEPEFRRRGLARRLMEAAIDWCKTNHIDLVILHASPEGRALYESLGFRPSNEMRIKL